MALNISWSPKALRKFHDLLNYLEKNWGEAIAKEFVLRTEEVISKIADRPKLYKEISKRQGLREAVITKHNLLIYKTNKNKVVILTLFDTRQHPKIKLSKL